MSDTLAGRLHDIEVLLERHYDREAHRVSAAIIEVEKRRMEAPGVLQHHLADAHRAHKVRLEDFEDQERKLEAELEALRVEREPLEAEAAELRSFLEREVGT